MFKIAFSKRGLLSFFTAIAFIASVGTTYSAAVVDDRVVVIVSIDGLAAFHLKDPEVKIPTIRGLMKEGAVADRMKASLPTLTWPNHTTLVTGVTPRQHGVMGNAYWDRQKEKVIKLLPDPIFDKEEIVKAPTIYDVAYAAGLKTAGINWPASRGAKTLHWATPDVQFQTLYEKYTTPSLLKEFSAIGVPFEHQEEWSRTDKGRERDKMYTQMLIHVLKEHRPHLAIIHLVEVDHAEHAHGPRSAETYSAIEFEDERVKEIVETLRSEFKDNATLFLTSDHGFATIRQRIFPNVVLRQSGLLKVENGKVTNRHVYAMDQGGSSFIYIEDEKDNRSKTIKQVAALFKGAEGIDQVIESKDFKKHGLASPEDDQRMPDMVLTAKNGFTFSDTLEGEKRVSAVSENITGAHGHSPEIPDLYAMFVAWGAGIKQGATLKEIENVDVAPTAAALLGLKMRDVDGHVLKSILTKDATR